MTPIQMPIAIFDISKYQQQINLDSPDYKDQAMMYGAMAKANIEMLKNQGYIVIDSNSIINAPEEYYANNFTHK